ncbi:hypothetical protein DXG01_004207 [Tephrocybe rancida]|nr:hypothetical protein DXG01_004207 [Tephrocybe rancida]
MATVDVQLEPQVRGPTSRTPLGLKWRSSYWFTTFVVTLGVIADLAVYTIIIPVMPFHLEQLGYNHVSTRTGWLLFAYSAGLVVATIPIAVFSERHSTRRSPLILGLLLLAGSQVLLMEAGSYKIMCVARFLQGVSSSVVWVVGLALLALIGPPAGGAVFTRFGYRGPFIFGIALMAFDLTARLLIIERKDALRWGFDPKELQDSTVEAKSDSHTPASPSEQNPDQQEHKGDVETLAPSPTETVGGPARLRVATEKPKPLSLPLVFVKLSKSPRAWIACITTLLYGVSYTSQEPTLPLHLQQVWGLNSAKVGLVFLASVIPTIFASPLTGWYTDKKGPEWVTVISLILSLPWGLVVIIDGSLALFIVSYALKVFFVSGVISPVTAELAYVAQGIEGVGYAHVYAVFNIAFGVGTAVGPIIGGQMYDHIKRGWLALCILDTGLIVVCIILSACYTGADPLLKRVRRNLSKSRQTGIIL